MGSGIAWLIAAAPVSLLGTALIPGQLANKYPAFMRRLVFYLAVASLFIALVGTAGIAVQGAVNERLLYLAGFPLNLGIYFDSLSAIMMLLISFIGVVITRYSIRYLDGDPQQGRFTQWISFTLGAVLSLVVSSNLIMFFIAWVATSFGLHQLLIHCGDRPAALMAARKKFLISRLGDILLVAALVLTYQLFGSFEYDEVFAGALTVQQSQPDGRWLPSLIAFLFVLGAMTKSAQFPMHSWLPDTMETPTPVSALMHAGIINAGGFLVIRLSPLIALSPVALVVLAMVGAFTALFAGIVMLTQTSVKRSLAYSTIAQMGFMMLQCGLGAFSAALLHIVAHSLYKAHSFLRSGSTIEESARTKIAVNQASSPANTLMSLVSAALVAGLLCITVSWFFGVTGMEKPGAFVLGTILTLAITQLLHLAFRTNRAAIIMNGLLLASGICVSYYGAFTLIDRLLRDSVSHQTITQSGFEKGLVGITVIAFLGTFVFQLGLGQWNRIPLFKNLYVHASNGFYVDVKAQKLVSLLWDNR